MEITEQEKKVFYYLNDLRLSGITNMFGATPYIMNRFKMPRDTASKILVKWMDNFNEDGYEHLTVINNHSK